MNWRLAITFAEHISMALSNLRLWQTLRDQSIRDQLTGLFNRRYLDETLNREIRRAVRSHKPIGVIMFDIDHFKKFNDNYGHEAGDVLLSALGSFLKAHTRGGDIACRYGGEEFTLIIPEATLEDTKKRAEELQAGVRELQVHYRDKPLGKVTVSLGVAVFPEHGDTAEDILVAADSALYQAKRDGRNRVVVSNRK